MPNVFELAMQLGLPDVISRAVSFHPDKIHLGIVWNIPVEFDNRLQTSAGYCHYTGGLRITLHPSLQLESERQNFIETFLHELAHAHSFIVYGTEGRGHGWQWHQMMWQLGQIPRRTHAIAACRKSSKISRVGLDDMGL